MIWNSHNELGLLGLPVLVSATACKCLHKELHKGYMRNYAKTYFNSTSHPWSGENFPETLSKILCFHHTDRKQLEIGARHAGKMAISSYHDQGSPWGFPINSNNRKIASARGKMGKGKRRPPPCSLSFSFSPVPTRRKKKSVKHDSLQVPRLKSYCAPWSLISAHSLQQYNTIQYNNLFTLSSKSTGAP